MLPDTRVQQEEHLPRHPSHGTSMLRLLPALAAAVRWVVATSAPAGQQPLKPASPRQPIDVSGTKLHYVERESGEPVVFVHGSLGTNRTCQRPFETLSSSFHVVAFSRRFHPPNETPAPPQPYAMQERVDDRGRAIIGEGSANADVNLLQVHGGLLANPAVRRFYESCGVL